MKKIIINRSILISLIFLGFIISISLIISPKKIDINNNYISEKIQNFTYSTLRNEISLIKNDHEIRHYPFFINNMKYLNYEIDPLKSNIDYLEKYYNKQ